MEETGMWAKITATGSKGLWRHEVKVMYDKDNTAEQVLTYLTRKLSQISQRTDFRQSCAEWVKFLHDIWVGARVRDGQALQPRTEQGKAERSDKLSYFQMAKCTFRGGPGDGAGQYGRDQIMEGYGCRSGAMSQWTSWEHPTGLGPGPAIYQLWDLKLLS